jgi:methyl-accepting chemotaxis protein/methyl-accepting chemotaxis protein-1 (serine sensor receptor)
MSRLGITAKIWLSIGIVVLSAMVSLGVGQVQGLRSESRLAATSEALFPAADRSQRAEAAFERMARAFQDAVLTEDASKLEVASTEAAAAVDALTAASALPRLDAERASALRQIASDVERLSADARAAYAPMVASGGNLTDEMMAASRGVAGRIESLKTALHDSSTGLAAALQAELAAAVAGSIRQRWLSVGVFVVGLLVAGFAVTVTIRKSIVEPVRDAVARLTSSAEQVAAAASEVAASSDTLSRGATSQAASLEETSASMEQMGAMTRRNAENSRQAAQVMSDTERLVATANDALDQMVAKMAAIHESSQKVGKIVKTIDEIAFQTNILALNAAVEAARAGEAGMGFAVVADEVRALAQRSAQAARDTTTLIEESIARAGEGQQKVGDVSAAIGSITASAGTVKGLIDEVSTASHQQAQGIGQVTQAISQMERVTQSAAAMAEESAAASVELNAQATASLEMVARLAAIAGGSRTNATAVETPDSGLARAA